MLVLAKRGDEDGVMLAKRGLALGDERGEREKAVCVVCSGQRQRGRVSGTRELHEHDTLGKWDMASM